jgi:hypothetical protein
MTRKSFTIQGITMTFAAACALIFAPLDWAQTAVVQAQDGQGGLRVLSTQNIVVNDNEGGESHTVEVRVAGDKVTVIRDGKEIPQDEISLDDEKIIITDKDGKKLHEIKLRLKGDGQGMYLFGGADAQGGWSDHESAMRWLGQVRATAPSVMLGVSMTVPGPALERHLRLEPGTCTMLSGVYEGLPANEAGLGEYDIIVRVDGISPADNETIRKTLAERNAGDTIEFTVIQEGKQKNVTVELKAYDAEAMSKAKLLGNAAENPFHIWTTEGGGMLGGRSRVFFAPERFEAQMENLAPQMERLREFRDAGAPKAQQDQDIEGQLRRLDERMAELEKLLQKLAEGRDSNR